MSVKDLAQPSEVQPSQKDLEGFVNSSDRTTMTNNVKVVGKATERKASWTDPKKDSGY